LNSRRPGQSHLDPFLAASIAVSVLGVAAFSYLFLRDLTVFWIILSPVIFAVYQLPAVALFRIYKKRLKNK
jgi:hypothetical protein